MRDALTAIGLGILILVGLIAFLSDPEPDGSIPVPPRGYEYCSDGLTIDFCPRGDR